jgi:hypothetical protein
MLNMNLILSVFVTDVRFENSLRIWGPKRYDAVDILKASLQSYSRIKFDKIYLLVRLDSNYMNRWDDLCSFCDGLFGERIVLMENRRIEKQVEWVPIISQMEDDQFVLFMQIDDHPFIDFDTDVLYEGLNLMKNDPSPLKALCPSHWPELIREAGVIGAEMVGSYLKMPYQGKEPFFIYSLPLIRHILLENHWPETLWRPGMIDVLPFTIPTYTLYVPLREQIRHFDGYAHVKMNVGPEAEFPRLELPIGPFKFTEEHLRWRFRPPNIRGNNWWLPSNIPEKWEDKMIELYRPYISD